MMWRISHDRKKTNAKIMAFEGERDLHLETRVMSHRLSTCGLIMLCFCVREIERDMQRKEESLIAFEACYLQHGLYRER